MLNTDNRSNMSAISRAECDGLDTVMDAHDQLGSRPASSLSLSQHQDLAAPAPPLIKSATLVAVISVISRIMGFIRDMVLAQTFGASAAFDAFVVAFKIPNFLRRLFGEGAFAQAFVPMLSGYREQAEHAQVHIFISQVATLVTVVLILITLFAEMIVPVILWLLVPGFHTDSIAYQLARHMLHITLPYTFLIGIAAFMAAVLNTYHRFALAAFSSIMLNVALIGAAALAPSMQTPIYMLAWAVLFGGAVQLVMQLPGLARLRLLPRVYFEGIDRKVWQVLKRMVPAIFGVSVAQLSVLLDNFFASFLPAGSMSWLYYSDRLTYLPLAVIAVALSTAVMPILSNQQSQASSQSLQAYQATLDWVLRCTLLMGVPAATGLLVLGGPLVATFIHHGAFTDYDVWMTRRSVMAYALGLPAFMLIKVLVAAFYSKHNVAAPVRVALIAVAVNLLLNTILMIPLAHAGLALSTSIASWVNATLLLWILIRHKIYYPRSGWMHFILRLSGANGLLGLMLFVVQGALAKWLSWHASTCIIHLVWFIGLGISFYILVLWLSGLRLNAIRPPV